MPTTHASYILCHRQEAFARSQRRSSYEVSGSTNLLSPPPFQTQDQNSCSTAIRACCPASKTTRGFSEPLTKTTHEILRFKFNSKERTKPDVGNALTPITTSSLPTTSSPRRRLNIESERRAPGGNREAGSLPAKGPRDCRVDKPMELLRVKFRTHARLVCLTPDVNKQFTH